MISWQTKAQGPWSTNIMVLLQRKHSWFLATWLFRKMVSSLSRTPCDLVTQFWRFTFCIILISHFKSSHARPLDFCQQVRMPFFGTTFSSSFCKHVHTCPNMSKHVQTCPNMSKHVQTCPNMSKHVQTCHIKVSQVSHVTELVTELVGFVRRNALVSPGNLPWRRTEALRFALCHVTIFHPCALQGPLGPYRGPTETTCAQLISNLKLLGITWFFTWYKGIT